jgi:hypothetical protein
MKGGIEEKANVLSLGLKSKKVVADAMVVYAYAAFRGDGGIRVCARVSFDVCVVWVKIEVEQLLVRNVAAGLRVVVVFLATRAAVQNAPRIMSRMSCEAPRHTSLINFE